MKRKYHYEYRIRCCNMCWGGTSFGPYRTLDEARSEAAWKQYYGYGPHWAIEKFRVYDD